MGEEKAIADQAALAAELNEISKRNGDDDRITQEQFNARAEKIGHVAELRKSGKFRILSVDTDDYNDGELIYDFDTEEDALMYVLCDREDNRAIYAGDLESMRKAKKKGYDLADGKATAQTLELGITASELRRRLSGWCRITSEVMFLYDPQGALIGEFPI